MNNKFLPYYNKELTFLKEMGREFALRYPKVVSRLALNTSGIPDPYIERLLEGVSFSMARTQLELDAEHPRFIRRILEVVYPDFINQKPVAAIVTLKPLQQYNSDIINILERGKTLRSLLTDEYKTSCSFPITHTTDILPIHIEKTKYTDFLGYLPNNLPFFKQAEKKIQTVLRIDFSLSVPNACSGMISDELPLYLGSELSKSSELLLLMAVECIGVVCHSSENLKQWCFSLASKPEHTGFSEEEALSFGLDESVSAFRVLQEYALLPEKFLFVPQRNLK